MPKLSETVGGGVERRRGLDSPLLRAVRDRGLRHPAARRGLEALERDPAGADHQKPAVAQVTEDSLGQRDRHRARGRRVCPDLGLAAGPATGRDRRAEQELEHGAGRSGRAPLVEGAPDLTQDLGLAQDERVETGGDATQMTRHVLAGVHVQVLDEQLPLDVVAAREHVDQFLARLVDAACEVRVELHPVAGREHGVLLDRRAASGAGPEVAQALAQLDGRGAVAQAEADEAVHDANTLALRKTGIRSCGSRSRENP